MDAAILTIGNEIVSGDVPNTNATWLSHRLERIGVKVVLAAAVPDDIERIVAFIRRESPHVAHLLVTGGLGGTPDDITREAVAAAFNVAQEIVPELADDLRARFKGSPEYAARWAALPVGSRMLENPLGGAPGFLLHNVWVFPGLPSEMEAMYEQYEGELRASEPIHVWRRRERTRESTIAPALEEATDRWPDASIGSYPSFHPDGPRVEVVVKSSDEAQFEEAVAFLDTELDRLT